MITKIRDARIFQINISLDRFHYKEFMVIQAVAKAAASMFSSRPSTCAIHYYVELFCLHGSL